jgi:hypothetical protein
MGRQKGVNGFNETGNVGFHINRAAPEQTAILDFATKWINRPGRDIARRNHISMPGKTKIAPFGSQPRIKVVYVVPAVFVKHFSFAVKTACFKGCLQDIKRTGIRRGNGRAADQGLGKIKGGGHLIFSWLLDE